MSFAVVRTDYEQILFPSFSHYEESIEFQPLVIKQVPFIRFTQQVKNLIYTSTAITDTVTMRSERICTCIGYVCFERVTCEGRGPTVYLW